MIQLGDNYMSMAFSYEGLYMRSFLECKDCGFVLTTLGQANHILEGGCPSCGEFDLDYATKESREKFVEGVKNEFEAFEKDLNND